MKTNPALLLLVSLLFALVAQGEEKWKVVDIGFQLTVPSDWQKQKAQGIDSNAGDFKSKRAELEFDEVFGLGYSKKKSQMAIDDLKTKEANPTLLKLGEEVWHVQGRLADFSNGNVDPEVYGKRRFSHVAKLFIPYEGKEGYLSMNIFYRSEEDLPTVRRVLQSVQWKENKPDKTPPRPGFAICLRSRISPPCRRRELPARC